MQKTSNSKTISNLCHNTNQSANNRTLQGVTNRMKKYEEYLISLFNSHPTLHPFRQQESPRAYLARKYTSMYTVFHKFNPLKFTNIVQLPREIYVSKIKQIRDIIEAISLHEQTKINQY